MAVVKRLFVKYRMIFTRGMWFKNAISALEQIVSS